MRGVGVALQRRLELQARVDPVQARGDDRAERQIGVEIRAADAVLKAQSRAVADDAQRAGAVVVSPGDRRRREAAGGEALVGVDVWREQQRHLAQAGELSREERFEESFLACEEWGGWGRIVGEREMDVA